MNLEDKMNFNILKNIVQYNEIIHSLYKFDSDKLEIWIGFFYKDFSLKEDHLNLLKKSNLIKANKKRKIEHVASRELIKIILANQYYTSFEIYRGYHGDPIWPKGYSGSISHKNNLVVAAIMDECFFIGVDIECILNDFSTKQIMNRILNNNEKNILLKYDCYNINMLVTLVFSAKETLFKAFNRLDYNEIKLNSFEFIGFNEKGYLIFISKFNLKLNKEFFVKYIIIQEYIITWISIIDNH